MKKASLKRGNWLKRYFSVKGDFSLKSSLTISFSIEPLVSVKTCEQMNYNVATPHPLPLQFFFSLQNIKNFFCCKYSIFILFSMLQISTASLRIICLKLDNKRICLYIFFAPELLTLTSWTSYHLRFTIYIYFFSYIFFIQIHTFSGSDRI